MVGLLIYTTPAAYLPLHLVRLAWSLGIIYGDYCICICQDDCLFVIQFVALVGSSKCNLSSKTACLNHNAILLIFPFEQ